MTVKPNLVLIGSTNGGILKKLLSHKFVRNLTLEIVSDRACSFVDVANDFNLNFSILESPTGLDFSNKLFTRYKEPGNTIFLSFYTKLFQGDFIVKHKNMIFNCHPSLLPLFPGMNGFINTINSSCKFMGSTIHLIDEGVDTGEPIIQAAIPIDRALSTRENRNKIFFCQYYSVLQFLRWINDGRLVLSNKSQTVYQIKDGGYKPGIFSPNLDDDFFKFIGEASEL